VIDGRRAAVIFSDGGSAPDLAASGAFVTSAKADIGTNTTTIGASTLVGTAEPRR